MTLAARPSDVCRFRRAVVGLAAVLIALAAGGCSSSARCPSGAKCPALAPRVIFIPTINGKSAAPREDGHVPSYRGRPGEYLAIRVTVSVPRHVSVTALWLGISRGTWGNGPNGPIGMNPILAHIPQPLSAGSHTFSLRWRIPQRRSGTSLYLTFDWSSQQPPAVVSGPVAQFLLR